MFRLLLALPLSAAALIASSTGATATAAPPQCLTNLVANVVAGKPTVLPPAPCSDPDGDALTIVLVDGPTHGVLGAQAADGTRTYTADAAYVGTDVVHFKASDGTSESAVSTLTINVQPASAPPGGAQNLDPQDVEPTSNPVDPGRCVGRGARNVQNGLLVGPVYRKPLQVFRPDGSGARFVTRLRRGRYIHAEPAWSPDGRQVAFTNGGAGTQSIWKVDLATGRERRVTRSTVDSWPAWSPDGRWIAFFRGQLVSGRPTGLWAVRPDGTGERMISALSGGGVGPSGAPSWSPNGRCLAVPAQDEQGQGLALVDSRGGSSPRFVLRWDRRFVEIQAPPSWSRDGRRLAFAGVINRAPFNKTRLLFINLDGTGERSITSSTTAKTPLFSPDGRTLVYSDRRGVYSMPARGGRARLIAPKRYAYAWGPRRR